MRINDEMRLMMGAIKAFYPAPDLTDCAGVWEMWESEKDQGNYEKRLGWSSKSRQECVRHAFGRLGWNYEYLHEVARKAAAEIVKAFDIRQPPGVRYHNTTTETIAIIIAQNIKGVYR